jgi:hypothetical protein
MDRDRVVTARFASRVQSLDVGSIGTGYGTASIQLFDGGSLIENQVCDIGMAVGPSRGGCFFGEYPYGSTVKLTATPAFAYNSAQGVTEYAGLVFRGWSAPCGGTAYVCTFALTSPGIVTARFDSVPYVTVAVSRVGSGAAAAGDGIVGGEWTVGPEEPLVSRGCRDPGLSPKPADCFWRINIGTVVKLQAAPDTVSRFIQWEGDATLCGTNPICSVVVTKGLNIVARFDSP